MFRLQESYQYTCTKCNIHVHVPIGTMIFWKVAMVFNNLYSVIVSKQKIPVLKIEMIQELIKFKNIS